MFLSLPFSDVRSSLVGWSERLDIAQKLLSLLNSYTPKEVRTACLGKSELNVLCSLGALEVIYSITICNLKSMGYIAFLMHCINFVESFK